MKDEGFTLIELLAVLVILAIVATVVFPVVTSIINSSNERASSVQEATIVKAAKEYYLDHIQFLPEVNSDDIGSVCIDELYENGYVMEKDVVDPKTKRVMDGCVSVRYDSNQYVYEYVQNSED